ncbi:hypothetical protein D3C72_1336880 [compost metagenome]
MLAQAAVIALQGVRHGARGAARKDDDAKAQRGQGVGALHGGLAAFHHIGQQRHPGGKARAGRLHLFGRAQRFDEERVGARFQIGFGAVQRGFQAVDGHRVGTRQDQRGRIHPRIHRRAQLAAHFGGGDHRLAVEMAAALGKGLVFQLDHRGARAFKAAHRALRVQRIAKARVGIHDDRRGHALGDPRQRVLHFRIGGQADVRAPQPGVGDGRARQVQRVKTRLLGDERRQGIVDAGGQHGAGGQLRFQCLLHDDS